jgi:hypothetical protein
MPVAGNSYRRGRIDAFDLLTGLDYLLFKMKILFIFVTEQTIFMRRSSWLADTVTSSADTFIWFWPFNNSGNINSSSHSKR